MEREEVKVGWADFWIVIAARGMGVNAADAGKDCGEVRVCLVFFNLDRRKDMGEVGVGYTTIHYGLL